MARLIINNRILPFIGIDSFPRQRLGAIKFISIILLVPVESPRTVVFKVPHIVVIDGCKIPIDLNSASQTGDPSTVTL